MLDSLTGFYSLYGPIASIRSVSDLIRTIGFGYAFIELADGRFAEVAVINDKINKRYRIVPDVPSFRNDSCLPFMQINGFARFYFHSSPSNPPPPMSHELQNPPESNAPQNIINKLSDLHLIEIFSYLLLPDLCSVADVCTKFRTNAKITYATQFENQTPEIDDVVRFESLARNFGTMIQSLSINCWLHPDVYTECRKNAVLSILVKYFSGPDCQLNQLILTKLDIDVRWHPLFVPIFKKLHHLRLDQTGISELLCFCDELVMLELCNDVGKFTANDSQTIRALDSLQRLTLWETKDWRNILFRQLDFGERVLILNIQDSEMDQDYQTVCEIFSKFPHLQELHLAPRLRFAVSATDDRNEMVKHFVDIFKRMVNLSTLNLNVTYPLRLQPFFGLTGFFNVLAEAQVPLQQLILGHDVSYSEFNSIARFGALQYLAINGFVLAQIPLMDMIKKLHQLKELRLLGQKSPVLWRKEDIKEIVDNGKQLCLLYFGRWEDELIIYEHDFNEIVHSIMRRVPRSKLTIIIRSISNVTLAVPADTIATFTDILQIKMLPRGE